jgi:hypothetical protein
MNSPKLYISLASFFGVLVGIYVTVAVHPENNYFYFMGLFAMLGILISNLILLGIIAILKEGS